MTADLRAELAISLSDLEQELRVRDLWESSPPAPERLASEVPFCHDTLEFTQWLQWVFLPRFRAVLEGGHLLPTACAIAPIAEDAFARLAADTTRLLVLLQDIDSLVTTGRRPTSGDGVPPDGIGRN